MSFGALIPVLPAAPLGVAGAAVVFPTKTASKKTPM